MIECRLDALRSSLVAAGFTSPASTSQPASAPGRGPRRHRQCGHSTGRRGRRQATQGPQPTARGNAGCDRCAIATAGECPALSGDRPPPRQGPLLERIDVPRLAGDVRQPITPGTADELSLDRRVRFRLFAVRGEVVAHGGVPGLVGAARFADVEVERARTLRRLREEALLRGVRVHDEQVPQPLEAAAIEGILLDRLD